MTGSAPDAAAASTNPDVGENLAYVLGTVALALFPPTLLLYGVLVVSGSYFSWSLQYRGCGMAGWFILLYVPAAIAASFAGVGAAVMRRSFAVGAALSVLAPISTFVLLAGFINLTPFVRPAILGVAVCLCYGTALWKIAEYALWKRRWLSILLIMATTPAVLFVPTIFDVCPPVMSW